MKLTVEQMQFLSDRGLSLADVIEFASLTPDRSASAERQARYRQRQKEDAEVSVTGDVTRDGNGDVTPAPLSPFPNENKSNPNPHTPPETKTRARKGHRLPVDWEPKPLPTELGTAVALWPAGAIERELARFRDWAASATGPNATKTDWDAAWRNWLRKADDEGRYRQNGTRQNHSAAPDRRDGVARALDRRLGLDGPAEPVGRRDAGEGPGYRALPAPRLAALR